MFDNNSRRFGGGSMAAAGDRLRFLVAGIASPKER